MILIGKGNVGVEADATIAHLKSTAEIDSKHIFLLPAGQDSIYLNVRKIKKHILEYATTFYEEKYKKYKKNLTKNTDLLSNEKNLALHFKMAVIDELT